MELFHALMCDSSRAGVVFFVLEDDSEGDVLLEVVKFASEFIEIMYE